MKNVTLIFDVSQLPERNGDEQEWADAVLACLRTGDASQLPIGVKCVRPEPAGVRAI
jgi:hypothetical protein